MSDAKRNPPKPVPASADAAKPPANRVSGAVTETIGSPVASKPVSTIAEAGSVQTSSPAQFNTATFGTPGARQAPGEPDLMSEAATETGEVDLFKVRRVTIPPDMRARMIDWWAHERHKSVPADTVPPNRTTGTNAAEPSVIVNQGVEPDTIPDLKHTRQPPDSVTPALVPALPMRPLPWVALAAVLIAVFALVLVAVGRRSQVSNRVQPALEGLATVDPGAARQFPTTAKIPPAVVQPSVAPTPSNISSAIPAAARPATSERTNQPAIAPETRAKPDLISSSKRTRSGPEFKSVTPTEPQKPKPTVRSGPDTESPPFSD